MFAKTPPKQTDRRDMHGYQICFMSTKYFIDVFISQQDFNILRHIIQ